MEHLTPRWSQEWWQWQQRAAAVGSSLPADRGSPGASVSGGSGSRGRGLSGHRTAGHGGIMSARVSHERDAAINSRVWLLIPHDMTSQQHICRTCAAPAAAASPGEKCPDKTATMVSVIVRNTGINYCVSAKEASLRRSFVKKIAADGIQNRTSN